MEDIVLVGYGGHAKSVADCIERGGKYKIVGYSDIEQRESPYSYLGEDAVLAEYHGKGVKYAAICVGYMGKSNLREKIYNQIKSMGFELPIITDPSAVVSDTATIDEGTFIGKQAVINAEANIGKMCIINTKAIIEHECRVNDFAHVAVGAVLCGQVEVGRGAFIGANATVIQCRKIDDYEIVPAGVTVRRKEMNNSKTIADYTRGVYIFRKVTNEKHDVAGIYETVCRGDAA